MKTINATLQTYLDTRKAYIDRNFFWITLVSAATYGFHDGDFDETLNVVNPATGTNTSRTYKGGGHVAMVPDMTDTPTMEIRAISFSLAMASSDVRTLVTTLDLRGAKIEWHKGFVSEATNALIVTPECEFLGFVNGVELTEGAFELDGDGVVSDVATIECVSHVRELTRTNVKTRSFQDGKERSADEIFKYTGSAHRWRIRWGKESKSHDQSRNNPPKNPPTQNPQR